MSSDSANDLKAFRDFADAQLSGGANHPTLDECLGLWEIENETPEERAAAVQAVRQALDEMRAGAPGIPAREAIAEFRRKYNLPTRHEL